MSCDRGSGTRPAGIILGTSLWDLALDPAGKLLYVADRGAVYEVDLAIQSVTTQILLGPSNLNASVVAVRPQLVACPWLRAG